MNKTESNITQRNPVVAIMGHIDHGKSTILSYIRKNTKALNEAGGITQHVSAYEVTHEDQSGKNHTITFLDTPGHEAFSGIRRRGAKVADVAVLVVSSEDGVKPQTVEALKSITESKTPYIVAINKIDKPEANIERTKQSLAENEIYVEGYGGDVPVVSVSGKTGEGIPELLDMIILVAGMSELTGDKNALGSGVIIESNSDNKKGVSAVCIIKNGMIKKGMYLAASGSVSPVRMMENYMGRQIDEAQFSSPVKIIGWDNLPPVGSEFRTFESREEAVEFSLKEKKVDADNGVSKTEFNVPIIVKTDTGGSLEAVLQEIKKLDNERIGTKVIFSGIGEISESDVKLANGEKKAIIIGFNTRVDSLAKHIAERNEIEIETFDVIYEMSKWLSETLAKRTPKKLEEEKIGEAKVLKIFSKIKDKQIIGCRVETGTISVGAIFKIKRREEKIGEGKIKGLELQKNKTDQVGEGKECGMMVEAKMEIAPGDKIESFIIVEK